VLDERKADLAGAGDDVHDAGGKFRLAAHVGEEKGRQRRRGGRLEDDGVAGSQRRRDLPREHEQREVPRDDLRGHAERARIARGECVLQLVRPAGVVPEVRRSQRHVHVARFPDGLATVERLDDGELATSLLEDARDPEEVLGTLAAGQVAPAALEGPARDGHRLVHVINARSCNLGEGFLGRRIHGGEPLTALGCNFLAADEQTVPRLELHDLARLGRGRVLPRHSLAVAQTPAGRCELAATNLGRLRTRRERACKGGSSSRRHLERRLHRPCLIVAFSG
jgi:ParB family chromosome partitioning protein